MLALERDLLYSRLASVIGPIFDFPTEQLNNLLLYHQYKIEISYMEKAFAFKTSSSHTNKTIPDNEENDEEMTLFTR